ncbi:MAG: hypothetical protein ABR568_17580 [Pyrinomonadaceae bacterium]
MVPEFGDDKELEGVLKEFYPHIFEEELESWLLEESDWPQNRDFEMFLEWFHIEYHSVVMDLAPGLPMTEEEYFDGHDDGVDEFD